MLRWEEYTAAAKELSPSALNLFMYLAKNQDKYELWFSSKDYCNTFNVTDKTFRNARKELLTKGYLKEGENNNVYFNSAGAYKETIENLKEELKQIASEIKTENEDRYQDFVKATQEAKLRETKDELVYKSKAKNLISFGKDILRDIASSQIDGLL